MKAITTTYYGPTNFKGSRIKATDGDNTVWVGYDHASNDQHRDAALTLCRKLEWTGKLVSGGTKNGRVWVFLPPDVDGAYKVWVMAKGWATADVLDLSMTDAQIHELGRRAE